MTFLIQGKSSGVNGVSAFAFTARLFSISTGRDLVTRMFFARDGERLFVFFWPAGIAGLLILDCAWLVGGVIVSIEHV
jgi:hypothetical protein